MLPISSQTSWQFPVRSSWRPTVLLTQVPLHPQLCTVHSWVLALKRALQIGMWAPSRGSLMSWYCCWMEIHVAKKSKWLSFFNVQLHLGSWSTFQKCGSDHLRSKDWKCHWHGSKTLHSLPRHPRRHVRYVSCVIIRSSRWQRHYVSIMSNVG